MNMKNNPIIDLAASFILLVSVIGGGYLYLDHQQHKLDIDDAREETTPVVPPKQTELVVGNIEDIPKQDIRIEKQIRAEQNIRLTFEQASKRTE